MEHPIDITGGLVMGNKPDVRRTHGKKNEIGVESIKCRSRQTQRQPSLSAAMPASATFWLPFGSVCIDFFKGTNRFSLFPSSHLKESLPITNPPVVSIECSVSPSQASVSRIAVA